MIALLVALQLAVAPAAAADRPGHLVVTAVENDSGKHLAVAWPDTPEGMMTVVVRHRGDGSGIWSITRKHDAGEEVGDGWVVVYWGDAERSMTDDVPAEAAHTYAALWVQKAGETAWTAGPAIVAAPATPIAAWINTTKWFYAAIIGLTGIAFFLYFQYARRSATEIFIRRIPGVDAIEDAIGRSTEMGRPILYVTGIEDIQDIQTVASLLILGHVAKMTAEYDSEIEVACAYPMTMVVAEEVVRQGYANAGRPDAHKPENVMFITSEQFAFAAAVNGMIVRDRPATNLYFGRFFAESLMLAETGFLTGAVQIAGTAEFTQLPFFIAACDYTLLGEELYAVSAYLSREPTLIAQLKAGDIVKGTIMVLILLGVLLATLWEYDLASKLMP